MLRAALILVALLVPSALLAQAQTGELEGVVRERETARPLPDVRVELPSLGRVAVTGDDGRFFFAGLPAGTYALVLDGASIDRATVEETVAPGTHKRVAYEVGPHGHGYVTTVRAPRVTRAEAIETRITVDVARHAAGTGDDPLKVVEDLPGVARAQAGSGQLIVWGAAPADKRVLLDGVDLPALYHVGGWRAIVSGELVADVALAPGAYGAEYGRALGGLVRVTTTTPLRQGFHGDVGADPLDASAMLRYVGRRFNVTLAGRYSWLDKLAKALVSPEVASFVPLPRYDDYQLQATLQLREREQIQLLALGADDALRQSAFANDPAEARTHDFDRSVARVALRYQAEREGDAVEALAWLGRDASSTVDRFGAQPASLSTTAWLVGARATYRRHVARWATVSAGIDLLDSHTAVRRTGSLTLPPREGDAYVFGQPPGDDVAAADDSFHTLDAAPFVSADFRAGPVRIAPGARLEAVVVEGNHVVPPLAGVPVSGFSHAYWNVDPRLGVTWHAHPRVTVTAATGVQHQPTDAADLSARFGNPTLGPARAIVVSLGLSVRVFDWLTTELDGFYRRLDGLAVRSDNPAPPAGQALTQDGTGRSYGGQLLLRQAPWHGLYGWVSYTLSRSERQDHANSPVRPADFDQTHVLALVVGWARRGWQLGARLRYASGFPRTPVVGSYYDARDDRYDPLFGAIDATRLPDFVQLDLRVERELAWKKWALRLYLDVQNVTYQRNAEEIVYSEDYRRRGYITGLPTLALLGVRVHF